MLKLFRILIAANIIALVATAVCFRCREIGNMPGVNGDEAWYGVQAESVLHGEAITWRTPTGNLLNPFYFGPQLLVHMLCQPSFAALRATAVASGLLALAVNYWLCRRVFGRRAAAISTTVLAVMPVNIIYSRLGWDASQSLLVTLPAIYWPLGAIVSRARRTRLTCGGLIALAAAIVVHPTNLFIAPIVFVALAVAWRNELQVVWREPLGLAAAFGLVTAILIVAGLHQESRVTAIADRVTDPTEYAELWRNLGGLLSGVTSLEYVAGPFSASSESSWLASRAPLVAAFRLIALLAGFGVLRRLVRPAAETGDDDVDSPSPDDPYAPMIASLLFGWMFSMLAFFMVAGPEAIAAHFERYGLFLVGPAAILAALGLEWWCESAGRIGRGALLTTILAGWTVLAGFNASFFDFLERTGGQSHLTFRTAAVEPKLSAFDFVRGHSKLPVEIRTSEWWTYWPLKYLCVASSSHHQPTVEVVNSAPQLNAGIGSNRTSVWQIEFTDSLACQATRQLLPAAGTAPSEFTIKDFTGRPILSIFPLSSESRQKNSSPRFDKPRG